MREERNQIENYAIYSDNDKHRYLLARIWDSKKPIPLFVSKVSGQADGIYLELTNSLITNNLYKLGYVGAELSQHSNRQWQLHRSGLTLRLSCLIPDVRLMRYARN